MPLELNSRLCGNVHVIECKGRIVAGSEGQALDAALRQDWCRNIHRVVLHLAEVDMLDSTGLGLIVRNMSTLRKRGGDLRLTQVSPFIMEILRVTRMDSVLKVFPSEQEAILSFLTSQAEPQSSRAVVRRVLLVDQSPDFCAFATAALGQHDHDVMSVNLVGDARILLQVYKVDSILIGPNTRVEAVDTIASTLKSLAPAARVLRVDPALRHSEPHHATQALLEMLAATQP
ncbi:MAG TPA: STAS domain-containing protein [Terracidiphilus sp.]|nr:STAS domain-containing protein [Terracidiphilus sp.]